MDLRKLAGALLLAAAFAITATAADVRVDYDHQTNFERYHTYSWGKVQTSNPLWQQRVQDAVDRDLQARGWQRVESDGDMMIAAVGSTQNQQEYTTYYDNMGGWRWRGIGGTATTTVENYRVGTLVVDIYDANSKQLIFRGVASDTLSDKPEHNERKLEKAVDKMFKKFPPEKTENR
jgi:hypothetical protein